MMRCKGYLDRLRENLLVLDEQIANARVMSKRKGKYANALQWAKTLRDLVQLRNETLEKIKAHMLGRDETGAVREPFIAYYGENQLIDFEREFQDQLSPLDLKLKCEDCSVNSVEVCNRHFPHRYEEDEDVTLCDECYQKRVTESSGESEDAHTTESDVASNIAEPASKGEIRVMLQSARLMIRTLKGLPIDQRIVKLEELLATKFEVAPGMEPAYEAYRGVLQKELDDLKASNRT